MNNLFHRQVLGLLSPPNLLLAVVSVFVLSEQRAFAQQGDTAQLAVNWEFSARQGVDGSPVLVLHARIHDGWKLYSTTNPDTLGYSRVTLDSSARLKIGHIEEKGTLQRKMDPIFNGTETNYFTGETEWLVYLQPGAATPGDLKGFVTFIAVRKDSVVGPTDIPFRYGHSPDGGWIAKSTSLKPMISGKPASTLPIPLTPAAVPEPIIQKGW